MSNNYRPLLDSSLEEFRDKLPNYTFGQTIFSTLTTYRKGLIKDKSDLESKIIQLAKEKVELESEIEGCEEELETFDLSDVQVEETTLDLTKYREHSRKVDEEISKLRSKLSTLNDEINKNDKSVLLNISDQKFYECINKSIKIETEE